jgi:GMP synthase-like glutamine amidotransferase
VDVLSLIHEDDARAGVFAAAVDAAGARLEEASLALDRPPSRPPHEYDAVMLFGGGMHVDQAALHPWLDDERELIGDLIRRERPLLGVCLGSQLVAEVAGAEVGPLPAGPEIGWREVELAAGAEDDPVLGALPRRFLALEWHSYGTLTPAPGSVELARNDAGLQAFRLDGAPVWGIQFHAEADAPTLAAWIEDDGGKSVDADALAERSRRELGRWNQLGRELARAFIEAARR